MNFQNVVNARNGLKLPDTRQKRLNNGDIACEIGRLGGLSIRQAEQVGIGQTEHWLCCLSRENMIVFAFILL